MEWKLYCSKCGHHRTHLVNPWQTKSAHHDSLSTLCHGCSRLMIVPIDRGYEVDVTFAREKHNGEK